FGGAGDLARRKLIPALYNLHVDGLLPSSYAIIGVARGAMTDEAYRAASKDSTKQFSRRPLDETAWGTFAEAVFYQQGSLEDLEAYRSLGARLDTIEHERKLAGNRIYYLAVPPPMFVTTVRNIAKARLTRRGDATPFARL